MPARACCLLLALIAFATAARADQSTDVAALVERAHALDLDADRQWLALLHINRGGTLRERGSSYVDDPEFFLAPHGSDDVAAELDASIRALFAADAASGDGSPACRFVARHRWLGEKLQQPVADPLLACPMYATWRKTIKAGHVALIFPGSYLNSPSSMFGHTLLRIDPPDSEASTVWLSRAVSFGADVSAADGSLPYVWKGLVGGYSGRFQIEPYFGKIQHYGRMENRDLWEYPLDLTATETAFMVDHLWELSEINFDYYFFDENCSFRLLELLEVARPSLALTERWRFSEVPVNTIRSVRAAGIGAAPTLRPSAERELRARVAQLDPAERDLALALVADATVVTRADFVALPRERQAMVLATAYSNMVYRSRKERGRDPERAARSLELLRALNALDINPPAAVPSVEAPESGHRTRRLAMGGGAQAAGDLAGATGRGYTLLELRPSYHDLLDPVPGYLHGAELELLDTALRIEEDGGLKLEHLDVANVFSMAPRGAFFPSLSWRVRGGFERQPLPGDKLATTRYVEGGGGLAWGGPDVLLRVFAEARVEHQGAHEGIPLAAGVGPALGLYGQHARLNWLLDARPLFFSDGFRRTEARVGLQWQLDRNWGLRANGRWRSGLGAGAEGEFVDADLSLQYYF